MLPPSTVGIGNTHPSIYLYPKSSLLSVSNTGKPRLKDGLKPWFVSIVISILNPADGFACYLVLLSCRLANVPYAALRANVRHFPEVSLEVCRAMVVDRGMFSFSKSQKIFGLSPVPRGRTLMGTGCVLRLA